MKRPFRIEPLLVALVTFVPVAAAYWLYYGGNGADLPLLANDERRIVSPPVVLPPVAGLSTSEGAVENVWAKPVWSLVYARTSPCTDTCREDLVHLLQVHLSLGRDQDRVQRVYLSPGEAPVHDPALVVGRLDDAAGARLLAALRESGPAPAPDAGRIYVVDPHGNLVLGYPPQADRRGLRDDLKRLLNVSRIG